MRELIALHAAGERDVNPKHEWLPPAQPPWAMLDLLGDNRAVLRINRFKSDQLGDAALVPPGTPGDHYFSQSVGRVLRYLQGRGLVGAATADLERGLSQFTAFTVDVVSRGWEVDLVANPSKQWTIRTVFSDTDRGRRNRKQRRPAAQVLAQRALQPCAPRVRS